jgi:predicted secreted Zn-dependent protease
LISAIAGDAKRSESQPGDEPRERVKSFAIAHEMGDALRDALETRGPDKTSACNVP